jgi:hypothetical protein
MKLGKKLLTLVEGEGIFPIGRSWGVGALEKRGDEPCQTFKPASNDSRNGLTNIAAKQNRP